LIRGRGTGYIREASPLFNSPFVALPFKGEGEEIIKRGFAPLRHPVYVELRLALLFHRTILFIFSFELRY